MNILRVSKEIPPEWLRLMDVAARIQYGEVRIVIQNGTPIRVEVAIKQIKLDSDKDFQDGLKTIPLL